MRGAGVPFDLVDGLALPRLLAEPSSEQRDAAQRAATTRAVADIARHESVRTALVWQNPGLVEDWFADYADRVADNPDAPLTRRGYRESMLARYAQRYCAKNESIGFFGSVGWARLSAEPDGLRVSGTAGVRRSSAQLEPWAVEALAAAWRGDPRLFRHLPVRLHPASTFTDGVLRRPRRPPQTCVGISAAVLTAIDGKRRCGEVLAAAAGHGPGYLEQQLRTELLRLDAAGWVQLGFLVPHDDRPDEHLRRQVEQLPDDRLSAELVGHLDDIIRARDRAGAAHGAQATQAALAELAERFTEAGCPDAARSRQVRYGRTAAYLDCRRDTDVVVGSDLLEGLREPLAVLLDSARWLAAEVGAVMADGLRHRYRRLRERRDEVTLADLQFTAADLLAGGGPEFADVQTDFQLRWAEILPAAVGGDEEVRVSSEELRPMVTALFPPPERLRWAASRQHSPDLMLGRAADGSLRWVLGELHVALNTLESRLFRTQCDDPDELVAATAADMRRGRVVPVYPLDAPEATARTYPPTALDPPGQYRYWSYGADQGHPSGAASVPATAVTVREHDGELIGLVESDGWSAPVLEFFGEFVTAVVVDLFRLRPPRAYLPRLVFDDVVVARRSWSVLPTEVPFEPWKSADRSFQQLRDWAADLGVPRRLFFRTPGQRKPVYLDLAAPLLIANFVRAVHRAIGGGPEPGTVELVEMLPGPDELWLRDPDGRAYTTEFRMVAVDDYEPDHVVRTDFG